MMQIKALQMNTSCGVLATMALVLEFAHFSSTKPVVVLMFFCYFQGYLVNGLVYSTKALGYSVGNKIGQFKEPSYVC